jgi:hypothetical protein
LPIGIGIDHREASQRVECGGSPSGMSCYCYNVLSSLAARVDEDILVGRIPDDLAPALFRNSTQLAWRRFGVRPPAVSLLTRHEIHSIIEPKQSEAFS